jgi:hypothetical protein
MGHDAMLNADILGMLATLVFGVQVVLLGLLLNLEMEAVSSHRKSMNYFSIDVASHLPPEKQQIQGLTQTNVSHIYKSQTSTQQALHDSQLPGCCVIQRKNN